MSIYIQARGWPEAAKWIRYQLWLWLWQPSGHRRHHKNICVLVLQPPRNPGQKPHPRKRHEHHPRKCRLGQLLSTIRDLICAFIYNLLFSSQLHTRPFSSYSPCFLIRRHQGSPSPSSSTYYLSSYIFFFSYSCPFFSLHLLSRRSVWERGVELTPLELLVSGMLKTVVG